VLGAGGLSLLPSGWVLDLKMLAPFLLRQDINALHAEDVMGVIESIVGVIGLIILIAVLVAVFTMNSNIESMQGTLKYIAKYISYKEIYYCPLCLQLSREPTKCPRCKREMVKK